MGIMDNSGYTWSVIFLCAILGVYLAVYVVWDIIYTSKGNKNDTLGYSRWLFLFVMIVLTIILLVWSWRIRAKIESTLKTAHVSTTTTGAAKNTPAGTTH